MKDIGSDKTSTLNAVPEGFTTVKLNVVVPAPFVVFVIVGVIEMVGGVGGTAYHMA